MIAQDAEDGHKITVNVVVHFYGRWFLVQEHAGRPTERFHVCVMWRKMRHDPPPTISFAPVVGDDAPHGFPSQDAKIETIRLTPANFLVFVKHFHHDSERSPALACMLYLPRFGIKAGHLQ